MLSNPLHKEIASLRSENDELRATVRNLRDWLMPPIQFPRAWGLTACESRVLAALYGSPHGLTREALHIAAYENEEPTSEIKIVDVFVCKARVKLEPHGVLFRSIWGRGYALAPEAFPNHQGSAVERGNNQATLEASVRALAVTACTRHPAGPVCGTPDKYGWSCCGRKPAIECAHEWKETGKSRMEIVETPRGSGGVVRHSFVRCMTCRAVGYRRDKAPVVYTWQQEGQCSGQ